MTNVTSEKQNVFYITSRNMLFIKEMFPILALFLLSQYHNMAIEGKAVLFWTVVEYRPGVAIGRTRTIPNGSFWIKGCKGWFAHAALAMVFPSLCDIIVVRQQMQAY